MLVVGAWVGACGEARLENAIQPVGTPSPGSPVVSGGSGDAGAGRAAGGAGKSGSDGSSGSGLGGTGGSVIDMGGLDPGGSENAGGAPPIPREPLITSDDFGDASLVGPADAEPFEVTDQPFTVAWRATMTEPPENHWAAQLVLVLDKPVVVGTLLHVSFWVRCEVPGEGGDCQTAFIFERASEPWEKSVTFPVDAVGDWAQKSEFFSVVDSYESGAAHLVFRLGYPTQTIAIGGIEVESIGSTP